MIRTRQLAAKTMPRQKPGRSRQNYETPSDFIAAVEQRYGKIDFDLAASPTNAKSECYYTKRQNALTKMWAGEAPNRAFTYWLNPPYRFIDPWVEKCVLESPFLSRGQILVLLPAAVGSRWFEKWVWKKAEIRFLQGRICFIPGEPYIKDSMLLRYRNPRFGTSISIWDWKNNRLI
jgi:phage N-6-adenine-methyltransferase